MIVSHDKRGSISSLTKPSTTSNVSTTVSSATYRLEASAIYVLEVIAEKKPVFALLAMGLELFGFNQAPQVFTWIDFLPDYPSTRLIRPDSQDEGNTNG